MKRISALALGILGLIGGMSLGWAQERCEVPALKVGDEWIYKTERKEVRYRVWEVTGDGYLIGAGNIYDVNTLNVKFKVKEGKKEKATGLLRKMLNFPLFVGKKWEDTVEQYSPRTRVRTLNYVGFSVVKQENVLTPAGDFNAFLISAQAVSTLPDRAGGKMEGWSRLWYSPQVKFWVKREYDPTFWPVDDDEILVRYKVRAE